MVDVENVTSHRPTHSDDFMELPETVDTLVTYDYDPMMPSTSSICTDGIKFQTRITSDLTLFQISNNRSIFRSIPHFANSNYQPMVFYLESKEEVRGGMARTEPDCIYRAHVKGVHQHSIVNLCDSDDGLVSI